MYDDSRRLNVKNFGDVRSLLYRYSKLTSETNHGKDNHVSFENLVPPLYKRHLISPHWHCYRTVKYIMEEVQENRLPEVDAHEALSILSKAVKAELQLITEQLRTWRSQNRFPRVLHLLGVVCTEMIEALHLFGSTLHDMNKSQNQKALLEFKQIIEDHESLREELVSYNEARGWYLLERFPGPFSPMVSVLGWGMVMHISGSFEEKRFRHLLAMANQEFERTVQKYELEFSATNFWQEAKQEARTAYGLIYASFFSALNVNGTVDPLIVRGALAMLAHALSRLNACILNSHPGDANKGSMFSASTQTLVGKNTIPRHLLVMNQAFYPTSSGISSN